MRGPRGDTGGAPRLRYAGDAPAAPAAALDSTGTACIVRRLDAQSSASDKDRSMAKSATILIKLVSTADTGFYYVTKKNPRNTTEKMEFRKYDPVVRKHVPFKEAKIK